MTWAAVSGRPYVEDGALPVGTVVVASPGAVAVRREPDAFAFPSPEQQQQQEEEEEELSLGKEEDAEGEGEVSEEEEEAFWSRAKSAFLPPPRPPPYRVSQPVPADPELSRWGSTQFSRVPQMAVANS